MAISKLLNLMNFTNTIFLNNLEKSTRLKLLQ